MRSARRTTTFTTRPHLPIAINRVSYEAQVGKRIRVQPNGCWLYAGRADRYGQVTIAGQRVRAHRWVYETIVGPIPDGHVLHHECETPGCVNPAHLTPVTRPEHQRIHRRS